MSSGMLPLYYQARSDTITKSAVCIQFLKRILKLREKRLVILIVLVFISISFFGVYFLPDFRELSGIHELDLGTPSKIFIPPGAGEDRKRDDHDILEFGDKRRLSSRMANIPPLPGPAVHSMVDTNDTSAVRSATIKERQSKIVEVLS